MNKAFKHLALTSLFLIQLSSTKGRAADNLDTSSSVATKPEAVQPQALPLPQAPAQQQTKPKPEELTPEQRIEQKKQVMSTQYYQSIIQEKQKQSEQDLPFRGFAADTRLDVIALGSNLNQNQPMSIWKIIEKSNPDLFLFVGNTVIAQKNTLKNILASLYRKLITNREYRSYREKIPFMAIWNNQELPDGLDEKEKESTKKDFTKKWPYILNLITKNQKGIYHSKLFGDKKNKHVTQVIMLDTRWDKNAQQVLSQEQWAWLESELRRPAGLRLLVSPMTLDATDAETITWSNFPNQKEKLLSLIKKSKVKNLILITSTNEFSSVKKDDLPVIKIGRLNKLIDGKEDDPISPSFTIFKIDWSAKTLLAEVRDQQDQIKEKIEVKF